MALTTRSLQTLPGKRLGGWVRASPASPANQVGFKGRSPRTGWNPMRSGTATVPPPSSPGPFPKLKFQEHFSKNASAMVKEAHGKEQTKRLNAPESEETEQGSKSRLRGEAA